MDIIGHDLGVAKVLGEGRGLQNISDLLMSHTYVGKIYFTQILRTKL